MKGNFHAIHAELPYVKDGDKHSVITDVDEDVRIKSPGKYCKITKGGDFVVDTKIGDEWVSLRHHDYFRIVGEMVEADPEWCRNKLGPALVMLTKGTLSIEDIDKIQGGPFVSGMSARKLLRTLLLIMIAEHRRFSQYEPVGGRNLIVRFLLGIIYDVWDWHDAAALIKRGKGGLRIMRSQNYTEPSFAEVLGGVA